MHSVRSIRLFIILAVLGGLGAIPNRAAAQSVAEAQTWTVTPLLSGSFGTSNDLGSSLGLGVALGYDMTSNFGVEVELAHVFDVSGDDARIDWSLTNISANAIYHFDVPHVTPYATFGLGPERSSISVKDPTVLALTVPSSTEMAFNFGGGVKYSINEKFLARADLRRFQAMDAAPDHWRLYGGVTWWIKR